MAMKSVSWNRCACIRPLLANLVTYIMYTLSLSVALQSKKHASLVKCVGGNMYHWWETRIPSDICVGKHTSLGIHVRETFYPGKHASLWHRTFIANSILKNPLALKFCHNVELAIYYKVVMQKSVVTLHKPRHQEP